MHKSCRQIVVYCVYWCFLRIVLYGKSQKVNVDKRVESWLPIVQLQQQQQQQHSRGPQIPDSQIQLKGSQLQQLATCLPVLLGCWDAGILYRYTVLLYSATVLQYNRYYHYFFLNYVHTFLYGICTTVRHRTTARKKT